MESTKMCIICLNDVYNELKVSHNEGFCVSDYHYKCFKRFMATSGKQVTCPNCDEIIDEEVKSQITSILDKEMKNVDLMSKSKPLSNAKLEEQKQAQMTPQ